MPHEALAKKTTLPDGRVEVTYAGYKTMPLESKRAAGVYHYLAAKEPDQVFKIRRLQHNGIAIQKITTGRWVGRLPSIGSMIEPEKDES